MALSANHYAFQTTALNGRAQVFTLRSISAASVDTLFNDMLNSFRTHPQEQPYLMLFHAAIFEFTTTITMRDYAIKMAYVAQTRRLHGRIAFVLPHTLAADAVKMLLRRLPSNNVKAHIFYNYEAALAWLSEAV